MLHIVRHGVSPFLFLIPHAGNAVDTDFRAEILAQSSESGSAGAENPATEGYILVLVGGDVDFHAAFYHPPLADRDLVVGSDSTFVYAVDF